MKPADVTDIRDHLAAQITRPRGQKYKRERFNDIEPVGVEWLVKFFLPAIGVGILAGPSTVGKTFFVLYVCLRIALGKTILGHKSRQAGVLYVAAEGQNGVRKRIKALRDKFEVKTTLFEFLGQAPNLLDREDIEDLAATAAEAARDMTLDGVDGLGLIVIDTTAAAMPGGNENAGEDMSVALANVQWLSQEIGCLVLLVGHTGKNEALGVRGWSGQIGNSDAIIYLTSDELDPKLRTGVVHKLKDGECGERFAYRLKEVSLGHDSDGDAITSAYPVFEEAPVQQGKAKRKIAIDDKPGPALILRALRLMIDAGQCFPVQHVPGVPVGTMGVKRTALRIRTAAIGYADPDDNADSTKRNINRDITALAAAKKLRVEGELVWLVQ